MSTPPIHPSKNVLFWAQNAKMGERIIYAHRAHSAATPVPSLDYTMAYQAHCGGLVFLNQRRNAQGWDYEATRISPQTAALLGVGPNNRWPKV